jgi:D-inositol-3-phosphate glycosyltransferase
MFHTLAMVKNHTRSGENEPELRIAHERWLAKTVDRIVVPTPREMDNLVRYYHARPSNIGIIPCGVDLDLFKPMDRRQARKKIGLAIGAPVILYVGRFAPLKGIDRLIQAVAQLAPQVGKPNLVIIGGDGPQAQATRQLMALAEHHKIGRQVSFVGRLAHEVLPLYYNAADFLALPSHYESFGLVVLEALACGTPVMATPVGGVESIVQNGVNGKVIASSEIGDVTQGLEWMFHRLSVERTPPNKIRSTVEPFGWQTIAARVADSYAELIQTHDPAQTIRICEGCGMWPN